MKSIIIRSNNDDIDQGSIGKDNGGVNNIIVATGSLKLGDFI